MKRAVIGVVVSLLVAGVAVRAQAPKPNPELQKLQPFIGDWVNEGEAKATQLGPAGKSTGKSSGQWILKGTALQWDYSYTTAAGQSITGREIDCYDPVAKTIQGRWFEDNGSYTEGVYTPNGNVIVFQGTVVEPGRKYGYKQTYTFAADMKTYTMKWEFSLDGKTWVVGGENKGTRPAGK